MVNNLKEDCKALVSMLLEQGILSRAKQSDGIVKYNFRNNRDPSVVGILAISTEYDFHYLSLNGLTNRLYGSGEQLSLEDVKKFISLATTGEIKRGSTLFGYPKIEFGGIVLKNRLL